MKTMAAAAKLEGKHTNHSARRTMITTLRHENVNPLFIVSQLSGQKSEIHRQLFNSLRGAAKEDVLLDHPALRCQRSIATDGKQCKSA